MDFFYSRVSIQRFFLPSLVLLFLSCATVPHSKRQQLNLVSDQQINALSENAYRELLSEETASRDARLTAIVERVGRRISRAAETLDRPGFDWQVRLIEKDEPNAFCMPGGKIAVYTGLLAVARNEAGLAAVMGHEVAHAVAHHGAERMSQQLLLQGALTLGTVALGSNASAQDRQMLAAAGLGAQVGVLLPFSRAHEAEADRIGLLYMAAAGYDPREAPRLWERMRTLSGGESNWVWLSTHPTTRSRIEHLFSRLAEALPLYETAPARFGLGETL